MKFKSITLLTAFLFLTKFSFAGATEDLWAALKGANYPNALTAIAAGADVKNLDPSFGTPLNFASCWADSSVVKALIDAKSEINFVARANGFTPLINAAYWGNAPAVKLLLAAGADFKIRGKLGQTILSVAVTSNKLEVVKLLVNAGADPLEKWGNPPLADLTLMNALIGGKEPNEKIIYIQTVSAGLGKMNVIFPPSIANAKESDFSSLQDIATYILDKGADANQKVAGTWGSIIFQATEFGKTGIVLALINAKANMEVTGTIQGESHLYAVTPIMMAALKGNNELVEAFCKAGANVNFVATTFDSGTKYNGDNTKTYWKTTTSNTAVSLAAANGHPDTETLLRKYGGLGPKELKKK